MTNIAAKNSRLLIILLALGIFSIALSYGVHQVFDKKVSSQNLASLEVESSPVYVQRKSFSTKESLRGESRLYELDEVEVGSDGEAALELSTGHRLKLLPNTILSLNQESEKTVLILRRGKFEILREGDDSRLLISKNGIRWSLREFLNMNETDNQRPPSAPVTPTESAFSNQSRINTLTPEYLAATMTGYRDAFQKCYSQLLLKDSEAKGNCAISFTVQKNGRTSDIQIISCEIKDNGFQKCITQVTQRAQFRSFPGEPVTTVFPLVFQ